ncbi:hypothetical protein RIF29_30161 [Crotalaria pallida]|uniref:PAS fold-2 domain-containing protein n=1 Tax=Crotalaria pallida TaxID=3830 RepID=A0AAN9HUI2_CROPI
MAEPSSVSVTSLRCYLCRSSPRKDYRSKGESHDVFVLDKVMLCSLSIVAQLLNVLASPPLDNTIRRLNNSVAVVLVIVLLLLVFFLVYTRQHRDLFQPSKPGDRSASNDRRLTCRAQPPLSTITTATKAVHDDNDYFQNDAFRAREITLLNPIWIHIRSSVKPFYGILHRIDVGIGIDLESARTEDPALSIADAVQSQKLAVRAISLLQSLPRRDIKHL